jgi:hypothetical protein
MRKKQRKTIDRKRRKMFFLLKTREKMKYPHMQRTKKE